MFAKTISTGFGQLLACAGMLSLLATISIDAAPPHPDLLERVVSGKASLPYYMNYLDEIRANGVGAGKPFRNVGLAKAAACSVPKTPAYSGEFKVLAILVDFSDNTSQVVATFFDSLVFGLQGKTLTDYYNEVSYGQIDLVTVDVPSSLGWRRAPQTYAYYVNGQNGTGSYPNNTQKLVEDLVDQVDGLVDFSQYDNDADGYVDILMVIHSGVGAEYGGTDDDIWSHKWGISPRLKDGVYISDYTVQPEYWVSPGDMTIGVYAHELGHGFGLPDLYDTDYSSNGIGKWGIMSYGSWLGPNGRGGCPPHFCAWCKTRMGILTATNVSANVTSQAIANVEENATAFRLWNAGAANDEYFLVENRQKIGYDAYLPSSGLLIWHVDDGKSNNTKEWYPGLSAAEHFEVALEQADGLYELEKDIDQGDSGDPFPGSTSSTSFNASTSPCSDSYTSGVSFVSVENISSSASTMYADLLVGFSADADDDGNNQGPALPQSMRLSQNYPNPFNPTTTISFSSEQPGRAVVEVYNTLGQKIATVFDGRISPGVTTLQWDATDDSGQNLASGVYFYKLTLDGSQDVKKMALVR